MSLAIASIIATTIFSQQVKKAATKPLAPTTVVSQAKPSNGLRDAIAGLKWGWSPNDVKIAGGKITLDECTGTICIYDMSHSIKAISWAESYRLIFGNDSLYKIAVISETYSHDSYGTEGKNKFATIDSLLSAKYSTKSSYMYSGSKIYTESDEFYKCLAHDGCGSWIKFYNDSTKSVSLELLPLSNGYSNSGFIKMNVEAKPEWSNFLNNIKKKATENDADAL